MPVWAPSQHLNQWWNIVNWTDWTNLSEILMEIQTFSLKKLHLRSRRQQNVGHFVQDSIGNTLRPRRNGRNFADDIFKRIFVNENCCILIKISLKNVPRGPINNTPALVQIMAWRRSGDKPLSEPVMVKLLTHISVTRPQWVKRL